jgi:uncharacterized protein (DUF608 family)
MGAGMICLEGTGAFSHFSLRHRPEVFNEPPVFAAISVKGIQNGSKVLEGPVPAWKIFGRPLTGNGAARTTLGLPRFQHVGFEANFPFAKVSLWDDDLPLRVELTGWSPFIPGEPDSASLPVAGLEYRFINERSDPVEATFSFNARNFMTLEESAAKIAAQQDGFVLSQQATPEHPEYAGDFSATLLDDPVELDACWFRGGWWDPLTVTWRHIEAGDPRVAGEQADSCPGGSLATQFAVNPGEEKTVRLLFAWYVPVTRLQHGFGNCEGDECLEHGVYKPWYAGRFSNIEELTTFWQTEYDRLRLDTALFSDTLFSTTLPDAVVEAITANLSILKSPTVLRLEDGRLWCYEGCSDERGCCHGTCTHVWNYAQAIPHLFPSLERTLRETEFLVSQDERGHQTFRSALPIQPPSHSFHAAADGQLGGIMKVYREWRISGDTEWMQALWPSVRQSLDYCIRTWDPRHTGALEEPHHNTYDIEFWGPDGMCTSFYLGALAAAVAMGGALNDDVDQYQSLLEAGKKRMTEELFDGEYFIQKVQWKDLSAPDPVAFSEDSWSSDYSPEARELLEREGPKYQYGTGCLSDGVLGFWIARVCGLDDIVDPEMERSHLLAVHRHNLKTDLTDHANPQRPAFALGHEGGLLLCTWPKGGMPTLPFVYSDEVWTGIEYQVAAHLMLMGQVAEAIDIVRECRARYDGRIRNPFSEYECGQWYARALASYGMLQGLAGVRYDAVDKTLYINSQVGNDFASFLSTESGYGLVGLKQGEPFLELKRGSLEVSRVLVSGEERTL